MKTLHIIRHAKAEEGSSFIKDFDRALTESGKADAKLIGKELDQLHVKPSMILSSPAKRALQTAQIVIDELDLSIENIVCNENIYDASLKTMSEVVSQTPDKVNTLMIFGHNPSFKDLVNYLSNTIFEKLPKGSVVSITFDTNHWADLKKRSGKVTYYEFPKNIRQYATLKTLI